MHMKGSSVTISIIATQTMVTFKCGTTHKIKVDRIFITQVFIHGDVMMVSKKLLLTLIILYYTKQSNYHGWSTKIINRRF